MRTPISTTDDLDRLLKAIDETEAHGNIADQVIALRAALRVVLVRLAETEGKRGSR